MKDETLHTTEIVEVVKDSAIIRRLFRKSGLASQILHALNSGDMYLSEIARAIFSDPSNVSLRINGNTERYRQSMIELGLIHLYEYNGMRYYGITEKGKLALEAWEGGHEENATTS